MLLMLERRPLNSEAGEWTIFPRLSPPTISASNGGWNNSQASFSSPRQSSVNIVELATWWHTSESEDWTIPIGFLLRRCWQAIDENGPESQPLKPGNGADDPPSTPWTSGHIGEH